MPSELRLKSLVISDVLPHLDSQQYPLLGLAQTANNLQFSLGPTARALGLYTSQGPVYGIPHLLPDPLIQLLVVLWDVLLGGNALVHSGLNDFAGDADADGADIVDAGDQGRPGILERRAHVGHARDGSHEHLVRDAVGAAQHGAEADAREDDRVIALGGLDLDVLAVVAPGPADRLEGRARGHEGLAAGPLQQILGHGLVQPRRVRQGKNDGALRVLGHLLDDVLGEGPRLGRRADQHVGLDVLDGLEQVVALAAEARVVLGVALLRVREVFGFGGQQAGLVDQPVDFQC